MDFQQIITNLLPIIGPMGVDALKDLLEDLAANEDKPWVQVSLALLADAVDQHGMAGIEMARKAIEALFENEVPIIDWASPRTASDFVARLQNAEADDKKAARDFFVKMGDVLSGIVAGIVKSLITAG